MKIKALTCNALARPAYWCAAQSPHNVDIELVQFGLHNQPNDLRALLQGKIDQSIGYDAVVLVYGLCGQSTTSLKAGNIPLVIPRCHDCITLFLGSRARYTEQFEQFPGTYWYAQDYIERDDGSGGSLALGSGLDTNVDEVYAEYVEKYGQDNADYLMEVMGAWKQHYKRAAYIDLGVSDGSAVAAKAQEQAARRGWSYDRVAGDMVLLRRLLEGDWEKDFLILQPGQKLTMTYDDEVIGCDLG